MGKGIAVPRPGPEDQLASSRQVVLILRLVLNRRAELRFGELLDEKAIRQGRFVTLTELAEELKRWLERQRERGLQKNREDEHDNDHLGT